jgi:hypothetical protein
MHRQEWSLLCFLAAAIQAVLGLSCETSNPAAPANNSGVPKLPMVLNTSLIPLYAGTIWSYVDSVFYSPDSVMEYRYDWTVGNRKYIYSKGDSVEVCIFRISRAGGSQNDYYFRVDSEGLVQYSSLEFDTIGHCSLQSLMLKYPVQRGDSWQENHGDYADQKVCLSTDTLVTISQGDLHCYAIRTGPGDPWYEDEFYCLNLGKSGSTTIIKKMTLLSIALPVKTARGHARNQW